jgi:DNA-binding CsgD family transcriptional regulator
MTDAEGQFEGTLDLLTPRERECLRLVDQHRSSKEIARRLGISKHTVDTHLNKARQKMGVGTRYDAARLIAASERRAIGIPTASGGPPIGIAAGAPFGPYLRHQQETPDEQPETIQILNRNGVAIPSVDDLSGGGGGNSLAHLYLGDAGAAAFGLGGEPSAQGVGWDPGVGDTQAGVVQTGGIGAARAPLHRLGADGRDLPSGFGGGQNDLSPLQRMGVMLLVLIGSALGFGAVLAGLHALKDLV